MATDRHSSVRAVASGLLLAALTATGCVSRTYMEMYDLPEAGWAEDQSVVFTFRPDSVAAARGERQWIDITVRHRTDFAYATLPLEIKGVSPDKRYWTDTVDFPLATLSKNGAYRWAGRSYSNHYDITRRYRSGIRYAGDGKYALSVRQLTGEDTLRSILSIGVVAGGTHPAGMR